MPRVSVVVPNYNHEKYLERRIESILAQTYEDFELILLDDCSTDGSRSIIARYRTHPKTAAVIYNAENSGSPFIQWNKGIEKARGELIWLAESDDWAEPVFLERTVRKMDEFPTAGLVYVQSREVEEATQRSFLSFHDHRLFSKAFLSSYFNQGVREIADKLIHENTIPNASGVLFRKDLYWKCGGADVSMRLCGDWMLWTNMLLVSDLYFIAEPLNTFRLTLNSVRNRQTWVNTFMERMKILDFIERNKINAGVAAANQVALMRRLFNTYGLRNTASVTRQIDTVVMNSRENRRRKRKAFFLSLKDRIRKAL